MINDIDKLGNTGKTFELVILDKITPLIFFELTFKQLAKVRESFIETLKAQNRKEAIEMSKLLSDSERTKFLVEAAKEISKVSEEKIAEVFDSVYGLIQILKISCENKSIDFETVFKNNTEKCIEIYMYALGVIQKNEDGEAQPSEKF